MPSAAVVIDTFFKLTEQAAVTHIWAQLFKASLA